MDLKQAILDLVAQGYSEKAIADAVSADLGEIVHQSHINRIKRGQIADPRHSVGAALIRLHQKATLTHRAAGTG